MAFENDGALKALKYTAKFFWFFIKMFWKAGKWIWNKIQNHKDKKAAAIVEEMRAKQRACENNEMKN